MIRNIVIALIFLLNYDYVESGTNPLTIQGGSASSIVIYKFMVSVHIDGYIYGGSIISTNLVITAAHCVYGIDTDLITVYVGSSYPLREGLKINIAKIFIPKEYNDTTKVNDISLLLLSKTLNIKSRLGAINLPTRKDFDFKTGMTVMALGFGQIENGSYAQIFQEGYFKIKESVPCKDEFKIRLFSQFCIGSGNVKLREGDDGSPVLYNNTLIGIVSLIKETSEEGLSVIVRVPDYLGYIKGLINQYP